MGEDLFEAARSGDVEAVRRLVAAGADLTAVGEHGFTALQCAALGTSSGDVEACEAVMHVLLDAGSPVDQLSTDGRTALYLAAELSPEPGPVELLVNAGADPDVSHQGVHVVINSLAGPVQEWLSDLSGYPVPPPPIEFPSVKLRAADWKQITPHLEAAFAELADTGLVVIQDAGTSQADGFADCSQVYADRGGETAGLHGFCFYSRADLNRAKRTSQLPLSFWAAPDGADAPMRAVGAQVVAAFTDAGFPVDWNGTAGSRPVVFLRRATAA